MGTVERRVDFDAGQDAGVAFEVGSGRREPVGILFGNAPAGGADSDLPQSQYRLAGTACCLPAGGAVEDAVGFEIPG